MICAGFNLWGVLVGWESKNLPGVEFRQAQTAISAYFIQQDGDFSLNYPTPVLGKPWSIPMEFPLYQWTVVGVSNTTGFAITKAGRLVSIVCFYLCLPAIFLLLERWRIPPARRWFVLALVLSCPFYIFYARAFLIETMALMFALWFWVAFERAVERRHQIWLSVAIITGMGAGLVKVTTFMVYLIPVGLWSVQRLWSARKNGRWLAECAWIMAAVALPFAATLWWLHFADAVKALNPMADFINSRNASDFTLGTNVTRFSTELWLAKWSIVTRDLTAPVLLWSITIFGLLFARKRWKEIAGTLVLFMIPLAVFPELYARHAYYFEANAVLLLIAFGLVWVAIVENPRVRRSAMLLAVGVMGLQMIGYVDRYYPVQSAISAGGDPLTQSLRDLTRPDEYLVVVGHDWNSMLPYYARRRALMLRADVAGDTPHLDAAFAQLSGEKIGALVVTGPIEPHVGLIARLAELGLADTPLYRWHDTAVFLPRNRRQQSLMTLEDNFYQDLQYARGVELPHTRLAGKWLEVAELRPSQRYSFSAMSPEPVRFFSTYGPPFDGTHGRTEFGAHPDTRLVFALPAGRHTLRTKIGLAPDSYNDAVPPSERSDGIEVSLSSLSPDGQRQLLDTRILNPRDRPEDRGRVPVEISFTLRTPGEVEFFIGPGPAGSANRDWATLERLVID